jgi:hypothetical protein
MHASVAAPFLVTPRRRRGRTSIYRARGTGAAIIRATCPQQSTRRRSTSHSPSTALTLGERNETIIVTSPPSDIAVETRSVDVNAVVERERSLNAELQDSAVRVLALLASRPLIVALAS